MIKLILIILILLIILKRKSIERFNNYKLDKVIEDTAYWFINFKNKEFLNYSYDLEKEIILDHNYEPPALRKLGSLWILTEYYKEMNNNNFKNEYKNLIENGIKYILKYLVDKEKYYIKSSQNSIAFIGFTIIILDNFNYYNKKEYLLKFGETLLNQQVKEGEDKGMFYNFVNQKKRYGVTYIPSQACLGLLKLYDVFKDERYINSVELAVKYYEKVWDDAVIVYGNIASKIISPSWLMQVTYKMYLLKREDYYKIFTFKLGDWLLTKSVFIIKNPKYNGMGVATFMEGLTDSYELAKIVGDKDRMNKYKNAIKIGYYNVMLLQKKDKNKLINNGFMQSENNRILRVDWNQHALHAFLKIKRYSIFD